ncbi:MAG TPA: alpha/beta fold hydrolase [Solirubrobacteraceae bacterium]|nr:alpha/beta fold hydrolase [Solirubrobacteraceae bacterium]
MRARLLHCLFAVLLVAGCGESAPEKARPLEQDVLERFEFPRLGAGLREEQPSRRQGVTVAEVVYPSSGPDNLTGFVVRRPDPGEHPPGVVFMHGRGGSARDFLSDATALARRGAVVLTIDSPFVRSTDETIRAGNAPIKETYDTMVQNVQDLLRALDILVGQYGADAERLAIVGYSFGAQPATLASALDERVRALVLMAGLAYPSGPSNDPRVRKTFGAIDTVDYVDNLAPTRLLIQGAEYDSVIPRSELELLYEEASEPKEIRWYDADHDLGETAAKQRVAWLVDQLDMS